MLGLSHLAIPGYKKVLSLSKEVQAEHLVERREAKDGGDSNDDAEDLASEAAFALQQLYALSGNMRAAQAITNEWLVL